MPRRGLRPEGTPVRTNRVRSKASRSRPRSSRAASCYSSRASLLSDASLAPSSCGRGPCCTERSATSTAVRIMTTICGSGCKSEPSGSQDPYTPRLVYRDRTLARRGESPRLRSRAMGVSGDIGRGGARQGQRCVGVAAKPEPRLPLPCPDNTWRVRRSRGTLPGTPADAPDTTATEPKYSGSLPRTRTLFWGRGRDYRRCRRLP